MFHGVLGYILKQKTHTSTLHDVSYEYFANNWHCYGPTASDQVLLCNFALLNNTSVTKEFKSDFEYTKNTKIFSSWTSYCGPSPYKDVSYQYRNSHYKDRMSIFIIGIPIPGKMALSLVSSYTLLRSATRTNAPCHACGICGNQIQINKKHIICCFMAPFGHHPNSHKIIFYHFL